MRLLLLLVTLGGLCQAARAEIPDCKRIADPAGRLTCYATRSIRPVPPILSPLPKNRRHGLFQFRKLRATGYVGSPDEDEALVKPNERICRGMLRRQVHGVCGETAATLAARFSHAHSLQVENR